MQIRSRAGFGGAGELGHNTMEMEGLICPCRNRGCLQMYATTPAIEREARAALRLGQSSVLCTDLSMDLQLIKLEQISQAAEAGDAVAISAINKAATYLGVAIASLVNTNNPHVIILGGPIPRISSLYVETAVQVMKQRAIRPLAARTVVRTAPYNELGGAIGAANFALDQIMSYSLLFQGNE